MLKFLREHANSWIMKILLGILILSFGLFWGVEVPDSLMDEKLDGEYIEHLYRFNRLTSKYIEESRET